METDSSGYSREWTERSSVFLTQYEARKTKAIWSGGSDINAAEAENKKTEAKMDLKDIYTKIEATRKILNIKSHVLICRMHWKRLKMYIS